MNLDLKNLNPLQIRLAAGLGMTCVAGLLAWFGVKPMREQEQAILREAAEQCRRNDAALQDIREALGMDGEVARLESALAGETNRFVLRPILGSYPVQRDIYRLAAETGFKVGMVREAGRQTTPVAKLPAPPVGRQKAGAAPAKPPPPPPIPAAFDRYVLEIGGEGSYADVTALIDLLESENPYCGVVALNIRGVPDKPERHRVSMSLEWPVQALPPPAADNDGRKRR